MTCKDIDSKRCLIMCAFYSSIKCPAVRIEAITANGVWMIRHISLVGFLD